VTQSSGKAKRLNRATLSTLQTDCVQNSSRTVTADGRSIEFNRIAIGTSPEPFYNNNKRL
jgi:hypothetical protein